MDARNAMEEKGSNAAVERTQPQGDLEAGTSTPPVFEFPVSTKYPLKGGDVIIEYRKPSALEDRLGEETGCWCLAGQDLTSKPKTVPPTAEEIKARSCKLLPRWVWENFVFYRPQAFGFTLPFLWTLAWWLPYMVATGSFPLYSDGWPFAVMMWFGSMVAGGTSEGGGSIAFPVMTLGFGLTSAVARDFSLMIQSVGMTAASFSILYSGIRCERLALVYTNFGAVFGCVFGMLFVAPYLPSAVSKMLFVCVWFAFALSLFVLNRDPDRAVRSELSGLTRWRRACLVLTGLVGGLFTSIAGSGVDICSFAVLTLLFRVSEKVATPTSVVLMGCNTVVGFLTQLFLAPSVLPPSVQRGMLGGEECRSAWDGGCISSETWGYWLCAAIIVPVGAPFGAYLASFLHRRVYAAAVYTTDTVQLVMAFCIVPQTAVTLVTSVLSFGGAAAAFFGMSALGRVWLSAYLEESLKSRRGTTPKKPLVGNDVIAISNDSVAPGGVAVAVVGGGAPEAAANIPGEAALAALPLCEAKSSELGGGGQILPAHHHTVPAAVCCVVVGGANGGGGLLAVGGAHCKDRDLSPSPDPGGRELLATSTPLVGAAAAAGIDKVVVEVEMTAAAVQGGASLATATNR